MAVTCIKLVVEAFLESCRVCLSNMLLCEQISIPEIGLGDITILVM